MAGLPLGSSASQLFHQNPRAVHRKTVAEGSPNQQEDREMTMNRRDFLKWQLAGCLATMTGISTWNPGSALASAEPDLAVVKGGPGPATRAGVELLGGIRAFVRPGDKVVIKPNMSFDQPPEAATNTHPDVIQALAAMCREAEAASIAVLDNPLRDAELCLETSGIRSAGETVSQCRVETMKSSERFREVDLPNGLQLKRTEIMKDVLEADVLIAAPVAKHHSSAGVSLSMKGMMGLILNRGAFHWRYDLHTAIVDLCTRLTPQLAVIDASRALTTHGPSGPGKVVKMDTVVASRDMVAADAQVVSMVKWYGKSIAPRQVKHIREAHDRGLGRMDIERLRVNRVQL